jgi:hypothetical protein
MTREETLKILSVLRVAYPKFGDGTDSKMLVEVWSDMLSDCEYMDVNNAIKRYIATNESNFAPSIGKIRSMIVKQNDSELTEEWVDAWGEVERAIRNHGYYREQAALESMSPITRLCVQAIGWKNICNSEEIGVERGHFRTMYESKAGSVRKAKQIQPALRTEGEACMLESILGNVAKRLN